MGVVFSAADSDPAWACAGTSPGSACSLPIATLAAGASREILFAVRAPNPLPPTLRQVANSACVIDSSGSSVDCDSTSTPLDVAVYVSLNDAFLDDRNHDGFLSKGDTLRYTLVVKNTSGQEATALTVLTHVDPHAQLLAGSVVTSAGSVFSGNHAGDTVPTVLVPTLAPGASVSITFDVLAGILTGLREISSQATASGSNLADQLSDDPETPEPADPTRTPLSGVVPASIPTLGEIGLALLGLSLCGAAVVVSSAGKRPDIQTSRGRLSSRPRSRLPGRTTRDDSHRSCPSAGRRPVDRVRTQHHHHVLDSGDEDGHPQGLQQRGLLDDEQNDRRSRSRP